jgi:hypothetical protein
VSYWFQLRTGGSSGADAPKCPARMGQLLPIGFSNRLGASPRSTALALIVVPPSRLTLAKARPAVAEKLSQKYSYAISPAKAADEWFMESMTGSNAYLQRIQIYLAPHHMGQTRGKAQRRSVQHTKRDDAACFTISRKADGENQQDPHCLGTTCVAGKLELIVLKPIGCTWSYLACRIGHLVPIWQPCTGSSYSVIAV